jgi:hypothetical protein
MDSALLPTSCISAQYTVKLECAERPQAFPKENERKEVKVEGTENIWGKRER